MKNCEKFPYNIFPPEEVVVNDEHLIVYRSMFNNLYTLYNYLNSDPVINNNAFSELESVTGSKSFAGKPYNVAVEDLIGDVDEKYNTFMKLQKDLVNTRKINYTKYRTVRTIAGGRLNNQLYSAGSPLCYETEEKIAEPKFVRIFVNLTYNCMTTRKQVINRSLVLLNVIKALENASYLVDLNMFDLSSCFDELFYFVLKAKKYGNKINMEMIYKTMCCTEFLRRVIFRLMETMDFKIRWGYNGYGTPCDAYFIRSFLNLSKDDLVFPQPRDMHIGGTNIVSDFENALRYLRLNDKIDTKQLVKELQKKNTILQNR